MGAGHNIYKGGSFISFCCLKSSLKDNFDFLIDCVGFNDTSTLVGHFVSSPRESEKRDRRDEREGQGRRRKLNESEEKEEVKTFPSTPTCCNGSRLCPTVSQYQLDALVTQDTRHLCLTQPPPTPEG